MELEKLNVFIEINGVNQLVGNISGILSGNAVFTYTDEYISNPDSRPISISLTLEEKSFDSQRTKNFFDGLLPEGFTRTCVAQWMHKEESDYISILHGLGRECLGAIRIMGTQDEEIRSDYRRMTPDEVKKLAQEGATESAELVTKSHLSLTGASGKVGLYYDVKNDEWYLPLGNAPSTHIVKQSHVRLKNIVANEQLCLLMAKELGIEIPESFIVKTDGRNNEDVLFATGRYDRKFTGHPGKLNGLSVPYRLHQEDFSQALGIPSSQKYEQNGGDYLKRMFAILQNYSASPMEDQLKLWKICIFNYLIGNTDNHIKNQSLLYSEDLKRIRLAPAYDIVSTMIYDSSTENMALGINGIYRITDISREDFEKEAVHVGLGKKFAMQHFDAMVSGFKAAMETARESLEAQGFEVGSICHAICEKGGIHHFYF